MAVSEFSKKQIIDFWTAGRGINNIYVIHNTVKDKPENPVTSKTPGKYYVTTIGNLMSYKNPEGWLNTAIKVCRLNNKVCFFWLGGGTGLQTLRERIPGDLRENIFFNGSTDKPEAFLKISDIYFHPSQRENHSLAILEAMREGLPCIAYRTGGNDESIINNFNGYLIEQGTDESIVAGMISELLLDHKTRKLFSYNSRTMFREKFSFEIWSGKMLEILS